MIERIKTYWKTTLCAIVIIYLSLIREVPLLWQPIFSWRDKIFHALAYTALTLLLFFEMRQDNVTEPRQTILLFCIPICLGGIIELLQHYFFAPRVGDWADFAANTIGTFAAFLICRIFVTK
ncbi:MAG: VanZ family protein [Paludibacteraceae bacterium]|nr:VanZ family protein [Paludibacteraceae bacterium]